MSAIVSPRARARKSLAQPSPAVWLATPESESALRKLAKKYRTLACVERDDLAAELAVAALKSPDFPATASDGFADWLDQLAQAVAGRLRRAFLNAYAAPMGDSAERVADETTDEVEDGVPFVNAADMAKYLDARRKRIARALGKLTMVQREAVRERHFGRGNLAAMARDQGKCDSSQRMNYLRGCRKLASLIDAGGYAMAA